MNHSKTITRGHSIGPRYLAFVAFFLSSFSRPSCVLVARVRTGHVPVLPTYLRSRPFIRIFTRYVRFFCVFVSLFPPIACSPVRSSLASGDSAWVGQGWLGGHALTPARMTWIGLAFVGISWAGYSRIKLAWTRDGLTWAELDWTRLG